MKTIQAAPLLKFALLTDAAASFALAIPQLLLPRWLSETLSLPESLISGTAVFLEVYTLFLIFLATRRQVWAAAIQFIVVGNVGWAIACVALMSTQIFAPSGFGIAYLAMQAIAVLSFAIMEYMGLKASSSAAPDQGLQYR